MNNIQKHFKNKSKLRGMADGGVFKSTDANGNTVYGDRAASAGTGARAYNPGAGSTGVRQGSFAPPPLPSGGSLPQAPATPAPLPAPIPTSASRAATAPMPMSAPGKPMSDLDAAMATGASVDAYPPQLVAKMAARPAGYPGASPLRAPEPAPMMAAAPPAGGGSPLFQSLFGPGSDYDYTPGMAEGGPVRGPGGPTDDKVGPVMLSDGEFIIPADTVKKVGEENLNALVRDTHEPAPTGGGNHPKSAARHSALRPKKMANGGIFEVDGKTLRTAGTSMVPTVQTPPESFTPEQMRAARAATNARMAPLPGAAPPAPAAPAPAAAAPAAPVPKPGLVARGGSALRAAPGATLRFAARNVPAIGAIAGASDSFEDDASGFREHSQQLLGAEAGGPRSVAGDMGRDALRVASNIGNTLTFGLAERLGNGLSNIGTDKGFTGGFMDGTERERFAAQAAAPDATSTAGAGGPAASPLGLDPQRFSTPVTAPVTGADPNSRYAATADDAVIGEYNGRPITKSESDMRAGSLQTASFMPQQAAAATDPIMDEVRSALRGLGQGGGGRSAPRGQDPDAINARYDRLADDMRGMYGRKGQGNLARRLLELEQARSGALGNLDRNNSTLRGQDIAAATGERSAQMQGVNALAGLAASRSRDGASAQAAQLKAMQEAQKAAAKNDETGFARYQTQLGSMFAGEENPEAAQEQFNLFVSATDPEFMRKEVGVASMDELISLPPQEQMTALQKLRQMQAMNDAKNASNTRGLFNSGATSEGFVAPVGTEREYALRDVTSGNLAPTDYLYNLANPFADDRVQEFQDGSVVRLPEYLQDSQDKEKIRRSTLRSRD